jgi:hypothetical protein
VGGRGHPPRAPSGARPGRRDAGRHRHRRKCAETLLPLQPVAGEGQCVDLSGLGCGQHLLQIAQPIGRRPGDRPHSGRDGGADSRIAARFHRRRDREPGDHRGGGRQERARAATRTGGSAQP